MTSRTFSLHLRSISSEGVLDLTVSLDDFLDVEGGAVAVGNRSAVATGAVATGNEGRENEESEEIELCGSVNCEKSKQYEIMLSYPFL